MGTFALLALVPLVLLVLPYFIIKNLRADQQDWLVSHARFRSR